MVTNSTVKQQKSHPLVERKVEGAELAKPKTPVSSKKEEEKEEEEDHADMFRLAWLCCGLTVTAVTRNCLPPPAPACNVTPSSPPAPVTSGAMRINRVGSVSQAISSRLSCSATLTAGA